ncbi:MAG: SDR family oxidoreductase [Anaerolineales bacterium]|nr:SDR family oxidoreductase [Anaerolineales bacterium]
MDSKNNKNVVLITGPAGNLGSAVVERYIAEGACLVLVDHHPDRLRNIYPLLDNSKDHLLISSVDLTDSATVKTAVQKAVDHFGQIDILVHTAGGFKMGEKVHETTAKTWDGMMDLNVRTLLNISNAVVPQMVEQQNGKIITIGARPALAGKARMGAYSAAKAAVLRLTESMSAELKTQGINVNCVLPGTIDTPDNRSAMPDADHSKWVSPDSLAEVIIFLSSKAAIDIHGAAIPVYGA